MKSVHRPAHGAPALLAHLIVGIVLACALPGVAAPTTPNIVLIYADDLGYGDVGAYGSKRISTPNLDRIAREGLRFTSGYSTSATCTPSRYSLLTGEYAWRKQGTGVATGDAQLIIKPGRPTLPGMLQKAGYHTGVVGKWHLGLGAGGVDWNGEIKPGPLELGFNESFIMPATGDRVPCVYIRNHRVVGLDTNDPISVSYKTPFPGEPTGKNNSELLKMHPSNGHNQAIVNGISRMGYMKGGKSALWKDEEMADQFTGEAVRFIERNQARPFFLYFALHDPHVPRVPHPRFVGQTGLGPRGDAIVQADWCVGEVLKSLERLKLSENTLVIVTSDNGPAVDDGYQDQAAEKLGDHRPSGPLRGGKYSKFEAGCRVPFLVRWPARVRPGVSDALVSQVDLFASFAALVGQKPSAETAPDSVNVLPALLGESAAGRTEHVQQGVKSLALREGDWKYIEPADAGSVQKQKHTETGNSPDPQLYDLRADPGEQANLAGKHPDVVRRLQEKLEKIRAAGYSRR